jgi:hypothetical protein
MNRSDRVRFRQRTFALTGLSVVCLVISCAPPTQTSWREEDLPQPRSITIDDLVSAPQAQAPSVPPDSIAPSGTRTSRSMWRPR